MQLTIKPVLKGHLAYRVNIDQAELNAYITFHDSHIERTHKYNTDNVQN